MIYWSHMGRLKRSVNLNIMIDEVYFDSLVILEMPSEVLQLSLFARKSPRSADVCLALSRRFFNQNLNCRFLWFLGSNHGGNPDCPADHEGLVYKGFDMMSEQDLEDDGSKVGTNENAGAGVGVLGVMTIMDVLVLLVVKLPEPRQFFAYLNSAHE